MGFFHNESNSNWIISFGWGWVILWNKTLAVSSGKFFFPLRTCILSAKAIRPQGNGCWLWHLLLRPWKGSGRTGTDLHDRRTFYASPTTRVRTWQSERLKRWQEHAHYISGGRLGCIECHGYCERWKVLLLTLSRLQKSIKMQLYKLSLLQWKISSSKGLVRVSKCCYMSIDLIICLVRKPGKDPTGIQTHSPAKGGSSYLYESRTRFAAEWNEMS